MVEEDDNKLVVGRALEGRGIFHQAASPFPASLEIVDEMFGIGSNFEKCINLAADHVIPCPRQLWMQWSVCFDFSF